MRLCHAHSLLTLPFPCCAPRRLQMRLFEPKAVPKLKLLPLAAAYVGYIVLCNLNLNINPVGFYQITKIAGECCQRPPAGHCGRSRTEPPGPSFRTWLKLKGPSGQRKPWPPPSACTTCPFPGPRRTQSPPRCWPLTTFTTAGGPARVWPPRCWWSAWAWAWPP